MSVKTLRRTKSQLRIATVVDSLSFVYPDRFQFLSSVWKPTNLMHIGSLIWEFFQMSSFAFDKKLPWSKGSIQFCLRSRCSTLATISFLWWAFAASGVGTLSSLTEAATLQLEQLPIGTFICRAKSHKSLLNVWVLLAIEGEFWGIKAQFYDWFIFGTVLLIAMYITTVLWIRWSTVDRHATVFIFCVGLGLIVEIKLCGM